MLYKCQRVDEYGTPSYLTQDNVFISLKTLAGVEKRILKGDYTEGEWVVYGSNKYGLIDESKIIHRFTKSPVEAQITFLIYRAMVVATIQSEVEQLALNTLGTHHGIFFDPIPLSNSHYLQWDKVAGGWLLHYNLKL
jgi:hypothetical protein